VQDDNIGTKKIEQLSFVLETQYLFFRLNFEYYVPTGNAIKLRKSDPAKFPKSSLREDDRKVYDCVVQFPPNIFDKMKQSQFGGNWTTLTRRSNRHLAENF
jgi:hypothetical protein